MFGKQNVALQSESKHNNLSFSPQIDQIHDLVVSFEFDDSAEHTYPKIQQNVCVMSPSKGIYEDIPIKHNIWCTFIIYNMCFCDISTRFSPEKRSIESAHGT